MTDEQFLLLIFSILYLSECLEWLPRWYVGFSTIGNRRWKVRHPSREFGNESGGLLWKTPFPPLGRFVAVQPLPVVLADGGIVVCALHSPNPGQAPPRTESFASWQELRSLRHDGKQLLVDGRTFSKVCSAREAIRLEVLLRKLADSLPEERESILRHEVRKSFGVESARRRLNHFRRTSRTLQFRCNMLFVYLFLVVPPVVWRWGFERTWFLLLVPLFGFMLASSVAFHSLHRRFVPRGRTERWTNMALACVAPHHAIRLGDVAARGLLSDRHPVACARLLLDDAGFRGFTAPWVRDLVYPIPDSDTEFEQEKSRMRSWWTAETLAFLRQCGLDKETLLAPPVTTQNAANGSFCPRCHSIFERSEATCQDCGGQKTVPIKRF